MNIPHKRQVASSAISFLGTKEQTLHLQLTVLDEAAPGYQEMFLLLAGMFLSTWENQRPPCGWPLAESKTFFLFSHFKLTNTIFGSNARRQSNKLGSEQ
jgi:hypothetical protein